MSLRRFFVICTGMLAAAMLYLSPALASERETGIYGVPVLAVDLSIPDMPIVVEDRMAVIDAVSLPSPEPTAHEALGPIYLLSMQTDGQSLPRYHMRC